jgi:hypothetical protein
MADELDIVEVLRKVKPSKVKLYLPGDEERMIARPGGTKCWHLMRNIMQGYPWQRAELLNAKGDVLAQIENVDAAPVDLDTPPDVPKAEINASGHLQLGALAGLLQLMLKSQQVALEENRRYTETVLGAATRTLDVVTTRLEGMERSFDKMLKLAYDTTRAQARLQAGSEGDDSSSSGALDTLIKLMEINAKTEGAPSSPPNGTNVNVNVKGGAS